MIHDHGDHHHHGHALLVPLSRLRPADSPRLAGLSQDHVRVLAAVEEALPPILVHRPTMQVIDGMHRLHAAMLRSEEAIAVEFFDGSDRDVFLRAVHANVAHGLPLTRADREAAVVRIISSHPHLSDRAIAAIAGVSAPTVGAIRRRTTDEAHQTTARIGRDGRIRPLNSDEGRRIAGEVIRTRPDASLREVAKAAGVSAATVHDVRERLRRGEDPVPSRRPSGLAGNRAIPAAPALAAGYDSIVENLRKDPSLRFNENGRTLLQWLGVHLIGPEHQAAAFVSTIPPHCTKIVAELARSSALIWTRLAERLEQRVRDIESTRVATISTATGTTSSHPEPL
jgi:transposase